MRDVEKFKEDIQRIIDKMPFSPELRRKFFSNIVEYATELDRYEAEERAGKPHKGTQNDE
jgi:hypothetical protein